EGELTEPGTIPPDTGSGSDNGSAQKPESEADADPGSAGMMRSSAVMAVGTMASRITGFARTIVLGAAIGTHLLGDAYHTAHTIPFILNDLLIGGLMASVIVPFLVKRSEERRVGKERRARWGWQP